MKSYNYYVVFFLMMFFGKIQAGVYPNYSQNIAVTSLNNNGQSGTGGGTISINNDVLTISISATWASSGFLKIGTVAALTISPALPNMELGQLSSAPGSPLANYAAKIENNTLVFYLTNSPTSWNGCYLNFTKNLGCDIAKTWYLDNDLDGLGDPLNFIAQQCTKPPGNYVLDNTDNCPMIPGTNTNCTILEASLQNQNVIKNVVYKIPTSTSITNPTISQASQKVSYFDGLGRPIQSIDYQASNSGKDIVTPIEYDGFGRQVKEYLPFASTQNNSNYLNPLTLLPNLITQYQTNYGTQNTNPFSEKQLEASPLNRVIQQAAPGTDWALVNNHTIKMAYQTNVSSDAVKNYVVNAVWNSNSGLYDIGLNFGNVSGLYTANQIFKTITKDENWITTDGNNKTTEEFKDKEGRVVLKRTYNNNTAHDTYYVYDNYGNLTYVLPPMAMQVLNSGATQSTITSTAIVSSGTNLQLTASQSITLSNGFHAQAGSTFSASIVSNQSTLDDLCYQYKYDYRNRLVEKKLPGKQWEYIVYDKLDRVVATGPALAPFNNLGQASGWLITKYDALNRAVLTGWMSATTVTSVDRTAMQSTVNGYSTISETKNTTTDTTINGVSFRYSNVAWPTSGYHVLTVNYFDDYNYPNAPTIPATIETQNVYYNNTVQPKGLPTGSWTRVVQASTDYPNELAYTLYDVKGRPIRTYTKNFLGGYTYTDSKLDFTGKPEYTITYHKRLSGDGELKTKEVFTYSPQDRLLTQTHQIGTATPELLVNNVYDELGQLKAKEVGAKTQRIDYSYNIRGWLTEINKVAALQQGTDPKDLFAFKINYNTISSGIAGVTSLYNGNIAETQWATSTDNAVRTYGYKYDALNRLNEALYKKGSVLNVYDEKLTYDANGNIKTLTRYGSLNDATPDFIDDLTYTYKGTSSNQLMKVVDTRPNHASYKNEFKDSATNAVDDYAYDANGNMIKDNNKNITAITYNHLNLPIQITFGSTGNISYIYNATGQKVQKVVVEPGKTTITTDYLGGYQYSNTALKFFPTAEGYVEPVGSSYKYVYQYKDHLGNVRLSYDKTLAIQEENNYYPFGLKHAGYGAPIVSTNDALKYKYNGKELQDELGLNVTAMDYRQYDSAIGRFNGMDRLTELVPSMSPYRFGFNNPVYWSDPTGLLEENSENLAYCPTCPNKPEFKPLIDDPNNTYVYDPESNQAGLLLDEVVVTATRNNQTSTSSVMSDPLFWINSSLGFSSLYVGYKANFHLQNEMWHKSKNGKIYNVFEKSWNKSKYRNVRNFQTSKLQLPRNISNGLAAASLVMTGVNVYKTGELKASDVLYATMAGASFTGVGSVVSGVFFVADFATMGISSLLREDGKAMSIGNYLDENTNGGVILNKNDFGYE